MDQDVLPETIMPKTNDASLAVFGIVAATFSTIESCACGPKYPLWRHVTRATVEPPIERFARWLGYEFEFPRNHP